MKPRTRFAILALIPLGCATGENTGTGDIGLGGGGTSTESAGAGGSALGTSGSATTAGTGTAGTGTAGTNSATAGTFGNAGTFSTAGTGTAGTATAGTGGTSAGGSGTAGATSSAGKSAGGAAGSGTAGTPATGGTGPVTAYCDSAAKSPLPYTVNEGFQPSGWQGDTTAVSAAPANPNGCAARAAGSVGDCTTWKFTPNATTPLWAGVTWSKMWDANYTHPPVCLAAGATKVTFQAKGALGGETVTFSAAGAAETPFTLTNAWKEYAVPLNGIEYNTFADGVTSGFFWKVAPTTPNGAPVTFFIDDIQFVK